MARHARSRLAHPVATASALAVTAAAIPVALAAAPATALTAPVVAPAAPSAPLLSAIQQYRSLASRHAGLAARAARHWVVRSGQILSTIAQQACGTVADWTGIYAASRAVVGADYNSLRPGEVLTIRCGRGRVSSGVITSGHVIIPPSVPESLAAYESCVIAKEATTVSNTDAWNGDHWGLFQMTHSLWDEGGGNPADWGQPGISAGEQETVFTDIVEHDINGGASNWTPYDGCPAPAVTTAAILAPASHDTSQELAAVAAAAESAVSAVTPTITEPATAQLETAQTETVAAQSLRARHHHRRPDPRRYWGMIRVMAMRWALGQRGKPYIWGATGPDGFDCSGLVYAAYKAMGKAIPRDTFDMLAAVGAKLEPVRHPRFGDLVFFGGGSHVELYLRRGWTFGAAHAGTDIGAHRISGYFPPDGYYRIV